MSIIDSKKKIVDYKGITEAIESELDFEFNFIYRNGEPLILKSLGYDFCQYYVFIKSIEGILVYGVENNLSKEGWFVYRQVVASFDELEFNQIFCEKKETEMSSY